MPLQELNDCFIKVNTELLLCVTCLSPSNAFSVFSEESLIVFAEFYLDDFSAVDLMELKNQLQTCIIDMQSDTEFSELDRIGDLAQRMVEKKRGKLYPSVYRHSSYWLPTTTMERVFSAMKIVKNRLRSLMGDQWMGDMWLTYTEKDIFDGIENETIIRRFQDIKTHHQTL